MKKQHFLIFLVIYSFILVGSFSVSLTMFWWIACPSSRYRTLPCPHIFFCHFSGLFFLSLRPFFFFFFVKLESQTLLILWVASLSHTIAMCGRLLVSGICTFLQILFFYLIQWLKSGCFVSVSQQLRFVQKTRASRRLNSQERSGI